ncbi:unnamed protein product [Auanema sp. JU1783]|nr:unnamed protein product [Auanema sp. JU1783]
MASFDKEFRLVVLGAQGVGKSSIIECFCTNYDEDGKGNTVLHLDDEKIRISVQESEKWESSYFTKFDGVVVIYSTDSFDTFEYCIDLIKSIRTEDYIPIVVIENKIDLLDHTEIEKRQVEAFLGELHLRLYRSSAAKDFNIMHPFAYVLEKLTRSKDENWNTTKKSPVERIRLPSREGWGDEPKASKKEKCSVM